MKKAGIILLAALACFACLIVGLMIGRTSRSGLVMISDRGTSANQLYLSENIAQTVPTNPDADAGKININTASVSLLQTLPNIGPVLAQRIVDFRTEYGEYTAPEDLLQVEGIGEIRLEEIRNYITVGG